MAVPNADREKSRLIVGILAADRAALAAAADAVAREFGPAGMGMPVMPFANTDYYRDELGTAPLRTFLAFPGDFDTERLAGIKLASNRIETELAGQIGAIRPVNIDPGYLTPAKLVLASAKNFSHRIHLSRGIFAEVTLFYRHGGFRALEWTFPDYASGMYFPFFLAVRDELMGAQQSWPWKSKQN